MSNEKFPHGTFCWNELVTRDRAGAAKFYTDLLGWQAVDSGMPGVPYTIFKVGEKQVGGLMDMPPDVPKEVPAHWMAYIAVNDIDSATARVETLGGKILHGPQDIPGVGRFSIIQDSTGGVVTLVTMSGK
jgi:predicted enzyme related to lactoylglutathione lyase